MKTRKQKVIFRIFCTIVSILLLASFFVVPVSALDDYNEHSIRNIIYDVGSDETDPNVRPYSNLELYTSAGSNVSFAYLNSKVNGEGYPPSVILTDDDYMEYIFSEEYSSTRNVFLIYYVNQLFDDAVVREFSSGDTMQISTEPFEFYSEIPFTQFRFTIRDYGDDYSFNYGKVVAYSDPIDVEINEDWDPEVFSNVPLKFIDTISSSQLCLCVEFRTRLILEEFIFTVFLQEFTILWGKGVSPNYPIYPSAPGKDDVDGLGSAEHELIQSQQQGINAGLNVMGDTSTVLTDLNTSLQLGAFATQLSGILDKIVTIPGIDALVQVSLALGLFASLMALSASIISAADRKAGQAKRDAARETKRDKKK